MKKLLLLFALLLFAFPTIALAENNITLMEQQSMQSRIGIRAYADSNEIVLTPTSTYASAVDWLEDFLDDEVGFVQCATQDLLQMTELVKYGVAGVMTAGDIGAIQGHAQTVDAISDTASEVYEDLTYYHTKLSYGYQRIEWIFEELQDRSITEKYRSELQAEARSLDEECQALRTELAAKQVNYTIQIDQLASQLYMDSNGNAPTAVAEIRNAAEPFIMQQANGKRDAEIRVNNSSIYVLSSMEIGVSVQLTDGTPLSNCFVTVSNARGESTYQTDAYGVALFYVINFKPNKDNEVTVNVDVHKDGYQIRHLEGCMLKGGQAVYTTTKPDDGSPYFSMLSYDGKDMLFYRNAIYVSAKNDIKQTIKYQVISHEPLGGCNLLRVRKSVIKRQTMEKTKTKLNKTSENGHTTRWSCLSGG